MGMRIALVAAALLLSSAVAPPALADPPDRSIAEPPRVIPVRAWVNTDPSDRYGVGQLVTVHFSEPIQRRESVERAMTVSAARALPEGSWGWMDDRTVVYRPRRFWPARTRITFHLALQGVVMATAADEIHVGAADRTHLLRTGRSFVLQIRDRKHRLYVRRDGRVIRKFPVSLGMKGWRTLSGIKVLTGEKYERLRMVGYDPGKKERWDVIAPWSIRLTPNGEFIHGAPWAAHRMGKWNGSHGCTNMFPRDARWLYHRVLPGDPVVTTGTGRQMPTDLGVPGAYWNYPWRAWKRFSALTPGQERVTAARVPQNWPTAGP